MLNCQTKLHAPFFPAYPSNLPYMLASSLIPPMIPILHDWNDEIMGTFRKVSTMQALRKKTHLAHLFLKDVFLYLDPKCVKFVPKFTKKQLPKGINFTYLEDPCITTCPFFPPCFSVPFFGSFLPPHYFNLDFQTQILRWRDWSQVEELQLLEFCGAGFVAQTCWKRGWNGGWWS